MNSIGLEAGQRGFVLQVHVRGPPSQGSGADYVRPHLLSSYVSECLIGVPFLSVKGMMVDLLVSSGFRDKVSLYYVV